MQGTAVLQFNPPKTTSYSFLFTEWTGKKKNGQVINPAFKFEDRKRLTSSMLLMLADIREGSFGHDRPKLMKHKYFCNKFHLCKKTVQKNLDVLEKLGLIETCGRSRYKVVPENLSNGYILIEDYFFGEEWAIGDISKRLTYTSIIVLEYICSMYLFYKKKDKPFVRSFTKLAAGLNFAPSTISDTIKELDAAGLIKRYKATPVAGYTDNIEDTDYIIDYSIEGVGDGYSLTAFVPDAKLLMFRQQLEEDAAAKALAAASAPTSVPEEPSEPKQWPQKEKKQRLRKLSQNKRRLYIGQVFKFINEDRQNAEWKAEYTLQCLEEDAEYARINKELRPFGHDIAFAEIEGDIEKLQRLQARSQELQSALKRRRQELGISDADIKPQYRCRICNDTGEEPNTGHYCKCVHKRLADLGYKL